MKEQNWAALVELYGTLHSWNKVAKISGISAITLLRARVKGFLPKIIKKPKSDYNISEAQKLYDSGLSLNSVAKQLDTTISRLRYVLKTRNPKDARACVTYKHRHSVEVKEEISIIMKEKMRNRKVASTRFVHNGIILESSWEKQLAIDLDLNGIVWIRPEPIQYQDNGQYRRYYPDFYLPEYNIYLDPKNPYVQLLDENKIRLVREQSGINLLVLNKTQLTWQAIQEKIRGVPASGLQNRGL